MKLPLAGDPCSKPGNSTRSCQSGPISPVVARRAPSFSLPSSESLSAPWSWYGRHWFAQLRVHRASLYLLYYCTFVHLGSPAVWRRILALLELRCMAGGGCLPSGQHGQRSGRRKIGAADVRKRRAADSQNALFSLPWRRRGTSGGARYAARAADAGRRRIGRGDRALEAGREPGRRANQSQRNAPRQ